MAARDPRIDAYIANSPEFSRPILSHLREIIHTACPDVEETMKWSRPHFLYKGLLCGMSAFKEHCAFGFWNGELVLGKSEGGGEDKEGMGQFGRITRLSDLPPKKILIGYVKEAMKLNEAGVKGPSRMKSKAPKPPIVVPDDLAGALSKNPAAHSTFENFSPSQKREYVDWLTEAKTESTRSRRLETAIEWMSEGKQRNWKYMNC
jgi:uncharacterized protein YdeI (YjbR/CyaY-like superfamily)